MEHQRRGLLRLSPLFSRRFFAFVVHSPFLCNIYISWRCPLVFSTSSQIVEGVAPCTGSVVRSVIVSGLKATSVKSVYAVIGCGHPNWMQIEITSQPKYSNFMRKEYFGILKSNLTNDRNLSMYSNFKIICLWILWHKKKVCH